MRLIDADAFESYLINRYGGNDTGDEIIEDLQNQPTITPDMAQVLAYECGKDSVQVVRCKDCKQFRRWIDTDICFCDITESERSDNDFCSRGERGEANDLI